MTAYRLSPAACPVAGVDLENLELDEATRVLTVRLARAVSEEKRRELCDCLRTALPTATDITICAPAPVGEAELAAVIGANWEQLLAGLPPVAAGALRLAQPQVYAAARKMTVALDSVGAVELLRRRGAAEQLRGLICRLTGHDLDCSFTTGADFSAARAADMAALQARAAAATQARAAEYDRVQKLCLYGREITADPQVMPENLATLEGKFVVAAGRAADYKERLIGKKERSLLHTFALDTRTVGILVKFFTPAGAPLAQPVSDGMEVKVSGQLVTDEFTGEVVLAARAINRWTEPLRPDSAAVKRVELHAHTNMSMRDAFTPVDKLIARAKAWGHPALAITDHGGVQTFPDAYKHAKKAGLKIIFGLEGYLVPDAAPVAVNGADDMPLAEFSGALLEVRATGGDPLRHHLCGYTLWPVKRGRAGKKIVRDWRPDGLAAGLAELRERLGTAPVAAPGGDQTASWLRLAWPDEPLNPFIDFDLLARHLAPGWQRETDGMPELFAHLLAQAAARGMQCVADLNALAEPVRHDEINSNHIILLVRNQRGLRNLYTLVSHSYSRTFYKTPRIPRSVLARHRDGLLLGSACEQGEVVQALLRGVEDPELCATAQFYDYLEMMPTGNNKFMLGHPDFPGFNSVDDLHDLNRRLWELGERAGRMVVATSDVHFLDPADAIFRQVLQTGLGYKDVDRTPPLYLHTTAEMRAEFPWLDDAAAAQAVSNWPRRVADWCSMVQPIPDGFCPPRLDGAAEELTALTEAQLRCLMGGQPPALVRERADRELRAIISNQFADLYLIAQKLVKQSNDDGYVVGSRGSVGSSFVAYLCGITEVNPLPPHYRCPQCQTVEFSDGAPVGIDLPPRHCARCGTAEIRDGYNIPFETFVGFEGNKTPDIDLNFSGEYQERAHQYVERLLGRENVFRAGTVATIQFKNGIGFARKYAEKTGRTLARAEEHRLARGLVGVKSTNGAHPGGLVVLPRGFDINQFTPVNFAGTRVENKKSAGRAAAAAEPVALTTHFDYHKMENQLVKLDILGHDMPTMMRLLLDLTGIDPMTVPIDDPATLRLFTSQKSLGVSKSAIDCGLGVLGLPEFGTPFVREMLLATKPTTIGELLLISGLSHGTDVWKGNAQQLIKDKKATLREVIALRDDIMLYLQGRGLPAIRAFEIMERVRKKNTRLQPADEEEMRRHQVPEWYIASCNLIQYMFPKAHAVAYTLMALRAAWFKVHQPAAFYAAYFSIKLTEFDPLLCSGAVAVSERLRQLLAQEERTDKEETLIVQLEVTREFYARGMKFLPVDRERSTANRFGLEAGSLRPPFMAVAGLGETVAQRMVAARAERPFRTLRDLRDRGGVNKAQIDGLRELGALDGLPEDDQLQLLSGSDLPVSKKKNPAAPATPAAAGKPAAGPAVPAVQLSLFSGSADRRGPAPV